MRIGCYDGSGAEWDAFVRAQAGWTHFHLHGWATVMNRVFGHECLHLTAFDVEGRIAGVLPLVRVRSRLFGHYLVSMPFVNYGGPLGSEDAQRALLDRVSTQAREERVDLLQVRARGPLPTSLPAGHQKLTVLIDIPPGGPDALFKQLSHKMRTKIRKPQKEGVEVRFGHDQLESFYHVLAHNMRDLGTPVQSRRFFEVIAETFGDSVWFACAYLQGKAVSGGCGFVWGDEMEITWSSSLRQSTQMRPGYLLHWAFLERAARDGCRVANFGRSTPGSGTHQYKQQWGGRDETQWWYYQSAGGESASTPSPDDGKYAWGPRLWRRLPVGLATRLGPLIVRSIP
jgi:FemAB-related protein (PEP-CTERM system-associated)